MNDNCVEFKAGVYAVILASIALLSCVAISEFSEPSLLSFALILVVLAYYFVGTLILNSRMDYLREEQGKAAPEKPKVT